MATSKQQQLAQLAGQIYQVGYADGYHEGLDQARKTIAQMIPDPTDGHEEMVAPDADTVLMPVSDLEGEIARDHPV